MRKILSFILTIVLLAGCLDKQTSTITDKVITKGQMPNVAVDKKTKIHLVYGSGDSLLYSMSLNKGNTFSSPETIAILPGLYSFATRGPQITITNNGVLVTAATSSGNIFSFYKADNKKWLPSGKVNDRDTIAKEGLMSLSSEGDNAFAVWLDLRDDRHNKLFGAKSNDGGRSWSKNMMVYTSPDSTICECCKPSVAVKDHKVYIMFRNWLKGNRDLYLIQSANDGQTFGEAQKLGKASWQLNGCPMDGGAIAVTNDKNIQTVWRRESKIYSALPGMPEKEIGEGRGCSLETTNKGTFYSWVENGNVVVLDPRGKKNIVGKGIQPVIKAIDNNRLICVWESDKQLHSSVIDL
ncbi:MAG: sialidase family protein [Ginsengibacter sp.]